LIGIIFDEVGNPERKYIGEESMEDRITAEDKSKIEDGIRQRYAKAAQSPEGRFRFPTGKVALAKLGYDPVLLKSLPDEVLDFFCGVGNPFVLDRINQGDVVLDVGCGAGVDTLIAATIVGQEGKAVGLDFVSEMVQRAKENLRVTKLHNVSFELGSGENLPFGSQTFDYVISNGVFNLIPDKINALREAFRVLKHGGKFMIADQSLSGQLPWSPAEMVQTWAK
jgi:SAM-dependent methyltransferase